MTADEDDSESDEQNGVDEEDSNDDMDTDS